MTERKMFEPADGISPRWQKLYDLVMSRKVGDEVTYREALDLLQLPRTDRGLKVAQDAMRDAQHRLEQRGERTVGTVAKFGWIVLDAQKELQQVDRRLVKTRRAAGRTLRGAKALGTRRGELSQFERERLDRLSRAATMATEITGRRSMSVTDLKRQIEGNSETA
jgi:hypothetical protein